MDHQSFLINEIDGNGEFVKYLCGFNLLEGELTETHFKSFGAPKDYIAATYIEDGEFDNDMFYL